MQKILCNDTVHEDGGYSCNASGTPVLSYPCTVVWSYLDYYSAWLPVKFSPITFHLLLVYRNMEETYTL